MEIVQNIQRADEAVTRTGPYQSQGVAPILSGISEGLLGLGKALGKGSGKSSGDAKGGAYDYFAQRTAQANSKNFSGPSELKAFADETYSTAMNMFGVSETEAKNLAEMTGFKSYGDIPVNMLKSETAIKTKLYNNALRAGAAIVGADASMDQKYAVGIQTINATENILNSLPNIAQLTPEQQKQYKDHGGFRTFEGYIRDAWKSRVNSSENADVPLEAAMLSFKNATIAELQRKGVDPLIAKSIADSALIYDEYSIYGDKVLEENGLQYYREAEKNAYDTDQAVMKADIKQQFLTNTYDVKKGNGTVKMTGAQIMAVMGEQGSAGSTGAAASLLMAGINNLDLLQQIANTTKSRYSYKNLRLSLSSDGAALATILKDNPAGEKNIGDMRSQADLSLLDSANTEGPANKPFIALQKMNEGYTLKDGRIVEPDVVDSMFSTPEEKSAAIQRMFDAVVQGSNKSTRENMFNPGQGYGLYQVDNRGKLQYYTLVGQRLENAAFKATLGSAGAFVKTDLYRFENHSNRGTTVEAGDIDAVFMRENMPEVERMFNILEKSFGANRQEMYDSFNNYMIRKTDAGKIYFEQSFDKGLFGGRQVSVEMTPADISRIRKELASLGEDSGPVIMKDALQRTFSIGETGDRNVSAVTNESATASTEEAPESRLPSANAYLNIEGYEKPLSTPIADAIFEEEGLSLKSYKDTEGYTTIGVGRNLDTNPLTTAELKQLGAKSQEEVIEKGITNEQAMYLFERDLKKAVTAAKAEYSDLEKYPLEVQDVIIQLAFNGGRGLLKDFKMFKKYVKAGNWLKAADELEDSLYNKQVPNRAKRLADGLRSIWEKPDDTRGTSELSFVPITPEEEVRR